MKKEDIIKLQDYFKEHDKTPFEHWAYALLSNELKSTPIPILTPCVELEKEVERLKKIIERIYKINSPYTGNHLIVNFDNFKTENNL